MWGLITSLNDILIPHLKAAFTLNYTEATLIQLAFFGAYFVMSMPSGWLVERIGYKRGIIVGLLVAAVGCVAFYPAAAAALLCAVPRRAVRARVGNHAVAGGGESVRHDPRPGAHGV